MSRRSLLSLWRLTRAGRRMSPFIFFSFYYFLRVILIRADCVVLRERSREVDSVRVSRGTSARVRYTSDRVKLGTVCSRWPRCGKCRCAPAEQINADIYHAAGTLDAKLAQEHVQHAVVDGASVMRLFRQFFVTGRASKRNVSEK